MIPNTIVLISRGRHEEFVADNGNILPGHILQVQSDNGVVPHAVAGGPVVPLQVAKEDVFQGGTINGVYNTYTAAYAGYVSGSQVMTQFLAKGDKFLGRIATGQNVTEGQQLMSNGDGTLIVNPTPTLFQITAPSTVITNIAVETAYSNGSYTIPANLLAVGDRIRIRGKVFCVAVNSTNTHQTKLYIGTAPITLLDSTALALIANDVVEFDLTLDVRTIGASGTFVAEGSLSYTISGTWTEKSVTVASQTMDTTVAEAIVLKDTDSAQSAGNQIRLDEFAITLDRPTGLNTLAIAAETVNNTGGTLPFIRCLAA